MFKDLLIVFAGTAFAMYVIFSFFLRHTFAETVEKLADKLGLGFDAEGEYGAGEARGDYRGRHVSVAGQLVTRQRGRSKEKNVDVHYEVDLADDMPPLFVGKTEPDEWIDEDDFQHGSIVEIDGIEERQSVLIRSTDPDRARQYLATPAIRTAIDDMMRRLPGARIAHGKLVYTDFKMEWNDHIALEKTLAKLVRFAERFDGRTAPEDDAAAQAG